MTVALLDGIKIDGFPVEQLYTGWEAISRHFFAGGLDVVLLRLLDGREACWWVDHTTNEHRGSHVMALPPEIQNQFLTALDPVLWPLAEGVLKTAPLLPEAFFPDALPRTAILEAVGSWISRHAPHAILIPTGHADSGEKLTCPDGRLIGEGRIRSLMATKRGDGPLIIASPFSELPLRAQLVMPLEGMTAYRFHDAAEDVVFYLVCNDVRADVRPSFYYPAGPLLISDEALGALIPGQIMAWYALNPDHKDAIDKARPFLPQDFGVGQASSLRAAPPSPGVRDEDAGETSHAPSKQSSSARPSFLPDIPIAPPQAAPRQSLKDRLKLMLRWKKDRG